MPGKLGRNGDRARRAIEERHSEREREGGGVERRVPLVFGMERVR